VTDVASTAAPVDAAAATASRSRAYSAARRHSDRVRVLKIAIPVGAVLGAALVVGATIFNPFGKQTGLTLGPVSFSGSKIAMEGPRLTGFRKDAKPYEVTATAAFQDIRKPSVIELKDMRAKVAIDDTGSTARLVSTLGVFDTTKEQLELSGEIRIATDKGDEVALRSASVDFKAGTVVSREPLRITTANGTIEAEGLQVSENGRTLSFTGRVRTQFDRRLATGDAAPAASPGQAAAATPSRYTEAKPAR
jgi:lipopolysaccharide export system protein LptC